MEDKTKGIRYTYFDRWLIYLTLTAVFKLVVEFKFWWIPLIMIGMDILSLPKKFKNNKKNETTPKKEIT